MESTRFSVLMSVYISEKPDYFKDCMDSLLNQTILPSEILIVKDGPLKEEVDKLIEEYSEQFPGLIRTVSYETNKGLGYALAVGVNECSCELIARMDTDDIARSDRFEKQLKVFEEDPELDICGSYIDEFEDDVTNIVARRTVPLIDKSIKQYQKRRDAFNHMTVMYKKSTVLKAGNYQTCLLMEDTLLWVRMMINGAKCMNIPEPLVFARIGEEMFERRGGFDYFLKYKNGRKRVLETGYISRFDYYYTLFVQFIVTMLPKRIRGYIFKKVLHNQYFFHCR